MDWEEEDMDREDNDSRRTMEALMEMAKLCPATENCPKWMDLTIDVEENHKNGWVPMLDNRV